MARMKVEAVKPFESWEAADEALRTIGEAQRAIEKAEHAMQEAIDSAKEAAVIACLPYRNLIAQEEARLAAFAEVRREELGVRKSREMSYGILGFRKSTKLTLPRGGGKIAQIIRLLKERGMTDCVIKPPEKIDKDALKKYPPNDIVAVGAGLDVSDNFWYEVKREELPQ